MKLGQPVPLSNFVAGREQRQPAQPAGVHARALLIEKHAAERRFGAVLEQHVALVVVEVGDKCVQLLLAGRREVERRR